MAFGVLCNTVYLVASLGHVAVGMLAGRALRPTDRALAVMPMVICSALSMLPDLDYVGVMLGIPDSGPCGHRGATHSLMAPVMVALLAFWVAPRLRLSRWRTALLCGLVVASHALLDASTLGSRGVPLMWPFSFTRFEMPWRPIPNAPCGFAYFSTAGLRVAAVELAQFLPVIVMALWPGTGLRPEPRPLAVPVTERAG
jgi:inner membrane protein